jgi:xanthine dehydrogenase accessory factor
LESEGYQKEKLDKVYAPIGLEIGAVTPEEIAIAIIAQVINSRRKGSEKVNWPETDMDVLAELSKEDKDPRALITIISTKGSVPREAGAKMLVWPDGKIVGSIGGGCSEAGVINIARDVIGNKGCQIKDIDMTASIAEEEGMVCGGIMQVLIEYVE